MADADAGETLRSFKASWASRCRETLPVLDAERIELDPVAREQLRRQAKFEAERAKVDDVAVVQRPILDRCRR